MDHPFPAGSGRAAAYNHMLGELEHLTGVMKEIADKYKISVAQVAIAWAVSKGTLPIIGVTRASHVEDAVKAAQIILSADEIRRMEELADKTGC